MRQEMAWLDSHPTSAVLMAIEERRRWEAETTFAEEIPTDPKRGIWRIAKLICSRVTHHRDAIVVITGPTGSGKSTVLLRLMSEVALQMHLPMPDPQEVLAGDVTELIDGYYTALMAKRPGYQMGVDEGSDVVFALDPSDPEQRELIRVLTVVREASGILFICIPRLELLNKSIRSRLAHIWIAITRPGRAVVHLRETAVRYTPDASFGFWEWPACPELEWVPYPTRAKLWTDYLEVKHGRLKETLMASYGRLHPDMSADAVRKHFERLAVVPDKPGQKRLAKAGLSVRKTERGPSETPSLGSMESNRGARPRTAGGLWR